MNTFAVTCLRNFDYVQTLKVYFPKSILMVTSYMILKKRVLGEVRA